MMLEPLQQQMFVSPAIISTGFAFLVVAMTLAAIAIGWGLYFLNLKFQAKADEE